MQKNYKRLILSIVIVLLAGAFAFGQETEIEYKDVILDGKPAKLNVATGEITLVNLNDKKESIKSDSILTSDKTTATVNNDSIVASVSEYYIVKEGETLFEIATRFNTSLAELKQANNLETTLVDKGQKLRVRNFESVATDDYTLPNVEVSEEENVTGYHIVEKGQTLYSLANRYGLTVNELKQHNGLISNLIKIGQKLQVANFNSNQELGHISVWTVSKGDTLYSIAKENGTTVERIKSLNGLTSNLIKIGQKLQLK